MKVVLDQVKCVSSGQCVMAAPTLFDQREEDGIAFLLSDEVDPSERDAAEHAAAMCPALAITVVND